jgi:integrase
MRRPTIHGFRRTFNNLCRQVAAGEVVRALTGHARPEMTAHYSHVDREKRAAAQGVLRLVTSVRESEHRGGHRADGRETAG